MITIANVFFRLSYQKEFHAPFIQSNMEDFCLPGQLGIPPLLCKLCYSFIHPPVHQIQYRPIFQSLPKIHYYLLKKLPSGIQLVASWKASSTGHQQSRFTGNKGPGKRKRYFNMYLALLLGILLFLGELNVG